MNSHEEIEKATAAREAREVVGSPQRRTGSRTDEVAAAMIHYLSTERYHERGAAQNTDDERRDPDETS